MHACGETPQPARETRALPDPSPRCEAPFVTRFAGVIRANLGRYAKPAEPHEQFRVHLDSDVDHHRPWCNESPGWRRARILPAQTKPDGRSPHRSDYRNPARARFELVGRV